MKASITCAHATHFLNDAPVCSRAFTSVWRAPSFCSGTGTPPARQAVYWQGSAAGRRRATKAARAGEHAPERCRCHLSPIIVLMSASTSRYFVFREEAARRRTAGDIFLRPVTPRSASLCPRLRRRPLVGAASRPLVDTKRGRRRERRACSTRPT